MENKELKFYEKLGVKRFRKFVYSFSFFLVLPFGIITHKNIKEIKRMVNETPTNYNIGRKINYEKIKNFKKMLLLNSSIHMLGLIICVPGYIDVITNNSTLYSTIVNLTAIFINTYCLMLQKYNYIRINNTLNKLKPKYEKELQETKENIREKDSKLLNHDYVYTDYLSEKDKIVNLDEIIEKSSLEQLKEYRNKIDFVLEYANKEEDEIHSIYIGNTKTLKIKMKK